MLKPWDLECLSVLLNFCNMAPHKSSVFSVCVECLSEKIFMHMVHNYTHSINLSCWKGILREKNALMWCHYQWIGETEKPVWNKIQNLQQ